MAKTPRYQGAGSSTINPYQLENAYDSFVEEGFEINYAKGYGRIETEEDEMLRKEAIKIAKEAGALVSFDPNYRKPLWRNETDAVEKIKSVMPFADIMKVSDEESILLTGETDYKEAAKKLLQNGPKTGLL